MENKFSVKQLLKSLKSNDFVLNCNMPLGYGAGIPILKDCNGMLCLVIPYLKYKVTGEEDKTLVYPIRYTITVEVPENKIVEFRNLEYVKGYSRVNFDKPCGFFRHEAIKHLTKKEYEKMRDELYSLYDKAIFSLTADGEYTAQDNEKMKNLLATLLDPCLVNAYKAIDKNFYNNYLA